MTTPMYEAMELACLKAAIRALDGVDKTPLQKVTPQAMRTVSTNHGWTMTRTQNVPGDKTRVAFEVQDNLRAIHTDRHGYLACVKIPVDPLLIDYPQRVGDWATDLASRHGNFSPAEILAQALIEMKYKP